MKKIRMISIGIGIVLLLLSGCFFPYPVSAPDHGGYGHHDHGEHRGDWHRDRD
jgi:hypothetical protein